MDSIRVTANSLESLDKNIVTKKLLETDISFKDLLEEEGAKLSDLADLILENPEEMEREDEELSYLVYSLINKVYDSQENIELDTGEMAAEGIKPSLEIGNYQLEEKELNLANEDSSELDRTNSDRDLKKFGPLEKKEIFTADEKASFNFKEVGLDRKIDNKVLVLETEERPLENIEEIKKDEVHPLGQTAFSRDLEAIDNRAFDKIDNILSQESVVDRNIERVEKSIVDLIEFTKDGDRNTMKVKLYPEELGDIELFLDMKDSSLNIKIVVENEAVKKMFLMNTDNLNKKLMEENIGANFSQVDIEFGLSQEGGRGQQGEEARRQLFNRDFARGILKEEKLPGFYREKGLSNLNILA